MRLASTRWLHGALPGSSTDRAALRGALVTIGNYDGLHRGHREILRRMNAAAAGRPVVVMGFCPTPREYFSGESALRLTRWRDRAAALADMAADGVRVDAVWLQRFDALLADVEAETFVRERLVAALAPSEVWIGDDFRFGRRRQGDAALLERLGRDLHFRVRRTPTVADAVGRISSTRLRDALLAGDFDAAAELLGRRYALHGRVAHGDARGRGLGFPTLNLRLGRVPVVLRGVYAGWVRFCDAPAIVHPAVANVGVRPTVDGREQRLEAHLLDVDGGPAALDAYGRRLAFEPVARLRAEQRFDGLDALRAQIARDVADAQQVLAASSSPSGASQVGRDGPRRARVSAIQN